MRSNDRCVCVCVCVWSYHPTPFWRRLCLRWLPRPSQRRGCGKWIDVTDGFGPGASDLISRVPEKRALPSRAWRPLSKLNRFCQMSGTPPMFHFNWSRSDPDLGCPFARQLVSPVASQTLPKARTRGLARSFDGEPCLQMGMFFVRVPFWMAYRETRRTAHTSSLLMGVPLF